MEKYIFRCDDVSVNTDMDRLQRMTDVLYTTHPGCEVIYGISVMVHNTGDERIYPAVMNCVSDYRKFYLVDRVGIPLVDGRVILAGHGLYHIDHRLLPYAVQELSIITSCHLVRSKVFIPPFNKWNSDTERICQEHGIDLIKWEDGWRHLRYHMVEGPGRYYFHTHDMTTAEFMLQVRG